MELTKFVDKLPLIPTLKPTGTLEGAVYYEIRMQQFRQKLHRDMPATTVWGFECNYPGPIIEAGIDQWIKIKWMNHLPRKHLLPIDTTVHGAGPNVPRVRTVIHLHGGVVHPDSDGYPEAWFTNGFKEVGPFFTRKIYDYPNRQRATTLWYHAHALGITRLNVMAGLAGLYILRNPSENCLNLPKGQYEIPLLIQDRSFCKDGSLYYPSQPDPPIPCVNPSIIPDFFGDTILVNGKVWPYLDVEPRKYRFRMVNGSNARFYRMRLSTGMPFYQIGTDGGLLERPVITQQIILAPAERADIILDFSRSMGQTIILTNDAPTSFPNGTPIDDQPTGEIMQFRVSQPLSSFDTSIIPYHLSKISWLKPSQSVMNRNLTLTRRLDKYDRPELLLDGKIWDDPISEKPRLGSVETWSLINLTNATHPIHLHLVQFQVLERQPFDPEYYEKTGKIRKTGPATLPDLNERGWKDTVRASFGNITRIIARFGPYTGLYVWHCHLLEHEDYEMMRPYEVIY